MRRLLFIVVALSVVLTSTSAFADTVTRSNRGFQGVAKGVFEIGFENLLLYTQRTIDPTDTVSVATSDLSYTLGLTPRYFVMPNMAVGLNANYFIRKQSITTTTDGTDEEQTTDDQGFIGFLMANYYIRTGHSFFFKPGLGAGYFSGTRETPSETANQVTSTSLSGLAGKLDLGVAFYPSKEFNLKAGIDVVYRTGEESLDPVDGAEAPDPTPFSSLDAGFNVGIAYVF